LNMTVGNVAFSAGVGNDVGGLYALLFSTISLIQRDVDSGIDTSCPHRGLSEGRLPPTSSLDPPRLCVLGAFSPYPRTTLTQVAR
jgi:hypothetical protein